MTHFRPFPVAALPFLALAVVAGCRVDEEEPQKELTSPLTRTTSDELARMRAYLATRYEPGAVRETFEDDVGDVIDCVAFREQPSLRRQGIDPDRGRTPSELDDETSMALLDGEAAARKPARRACPPDTVSLRHYTLDDLWAYGTLDRFLRRNHTGQSLRDVDYTSHEHAQNFYVAKNWGASTTLNVWIPPEIEKGDFSLSQMWVTAGKRPNEQTVEAGWIAYRDEPDGKAVPRLFIYSTSDGYQSTGCYNSLCDRFVKMPTSQIVLDGRFASTSELGGTQRVFTLRWQLCTTSTCGAGRGGGSNTRAAGIRSGLASTLGAFSTQHDSPMPRIS